MLHVVILKFGQVASEVALGELGFVAEGAGEDAPAERGVGDDGDVEVGAGFGDAVGEDGGVPEGEFDFDGGDGVDLCAVLVSFVDQRRKGREKRTLVE